MRAETAFAQVAQGGGGLELAVTREALQGPFACDQALGLHEIQDCLPGRASLFGRGLAQTPDCADRRAQRHPEHVRADLPTDSLGFHLIGQLKEDLTRQMGQWSAEAARSGELRDQKSGPFDCGIKEDQSVQLSSFSATT